MTLILALGACAGDDPAAPPVSTPSILGSYQGAWAYILAYDPPGGDQDLVCPGALTVASQVPNGTFTGTWTQQLTSEDCNSATGTLAGIVSPNGAITVVSLSQDGGGSGTSLEDVTGGECVATRFDDAYRGTADGTGLQISYAISGECGGSRAVSWISSFSGTIAVSSSEIGASVLGPDSAPEP